MTFRFQFHFSNKRNQLWIKSFVDSWSLRSNLSCEDQEFSCGLGRWNLKLLSSQNLSHNPTGRSRNVVLRVAAAVYAQMDCRLERVETSGWFHRRPHIPHYLSNPHLSRSASSFHALKMIFARHLYQTYRENTHSTSFCMLAFTLKHVLTLLKLAT